MGNSQDRHYQERHFSVITTVLPPIHVDLPSNQPWCMQLRTIVYTSTRVLYLSLRARRLRIALKVSVGGVSRSLFFSSPKKHV